ncbi:hypothetical protein HTZ84_15085 [Haloterrigena sp. SYSU A558-1]|uniref:Uncharacterized protein n=1 Tax=Haloterrigena gelatinilytica TaxID=2741724 RepID=A0ABX2LBH3_9EURY|nr:hypothetical protein [Haloterrigena gelatinilytica]NUC73614.1 hypothetical protein [Haloterrigena gelatinilytica]
MAIGFANGVVDYPSFLKDAGYEEENISPSFLNANGDRVKTDIIFASQRYVLVFECEPEELTNSTVSKLDDIDLDNLRTEFSHAVTNGGMGHQIVYFGLDDIESDVDDLDIDSPALLYDKHTKTLEKINTFDDTALDRQVSSSTIDYFPSHFIPILGDDHPALVAEKVYQKLCSETFEGGATTDAYHIAEKIYEDFWNDLSGSEKQEIIDKIDVALSEFAAKNGNRHMRKLEDSDRQYFVNTSDAFMDRCQRAIKDLADDDSYQGTFESFD